MGPHRGLRAGLYAVGAGGLAEMRLEEGRVTLIEMWDDKTRPHPGLVLG